MTAFVFLHVGDDPTIPELLVKSIERLIPFGTHHIVHCCDPNTPKVKGADFAYVHDGDPSNLMTFRLEAFAGLNMVKPAVYLDTDMLLLREIDPAAILGDADAVLCRRSLNTAIPFNHEFRGMDLSEYEGRTMAEVYPFLACFTITRDNRFWVEAATNLRMMDRKFWKWYGDQEALKTAWLRSELKLRAVKEADVACLPEFMGLSPVNPYLMHFKGKKRKQAMIDFAVELLGDT